MDDIQINARELILEKLRAEPGFHNLKVLLDDLRLPDTIETRRVWLKLLVDELVDLDDVVAGTTSHDTELVSIKAR